MSGYQLERDEDSLKLQCKDGLSLPFANWLRAEGWMFYGRPSAKTFFNALAEGAYGRRKAAPSPKGFVMNKQEAFYTVNCARKARRVVREIVLKYDCSLSQLIADFIAGNWIKIKQVVPEQLGGKVSQKPTDSLQKPVWDEEVRGLTWRDMPGAGAGIGEQRMNFALFRRGLLTDEDIARDEDGRTGMQRKYRAYEMMERRRKLREQQRAEEQRELMRPFGAGRCA